MKDKVEGKLEQGMGKMKEEAGKLGGDRSTEIEGKLEQGKGKLKEAVGDIKEGLREEEEDTVMRERRISG